MISVETIQHMGHESPLAFINAHRVENDRPLLSALTDELVAHHLKLITIHAPFGADPWRGETHNETIVREVLKDAQDCRDIEMAGICLEWLATRCPFQLDQIADAIAG